MTDRRKTWTRPAATAGVLALVGAGSVWGAAPASAEETEVPRPSSFTSAFTVNATPDMVIDMEGEPVPGEEGASGAYSFMINSDEEIICYDITLTGVTGEYESPAKTATHIHEAPRGEAGPPRLAFPDPQGEGDTRTSSGCLQGPFTTGLEGDDGQDTAAGFTLSQIEDDPSQFFGDTHTAEFTAGTIRGQLTPVPVGGVDTGLGGAQASQGAPTAALVGGVAVAAVAGIAGVAAVRRTRTQG